MLIGVATTIAKEFKYDGLKACEFAKNLGFNAVQIYYKDTYNKNDAVNIKSQNLATIGHSDGENNLSLEIPSKEISFFLKALSEPIIIFHYHIGNPDNYLSNIEQIINSGVKVALENTCKDEQTRESFLDLLKKAKSNQIIPVLDMKRYFKIGMKNEFFSDLNFVIDKFNSLILQIENIEEIDHESLKRAIQSNPLMIIAEDDGIVMCKKTLSLIKQNI